jgi:hypothetical protein
MFCAGEAVEFIQFDVLCKDLSDHFPVGGFSLLTGAFDGMPSNTPIPKTFRFSF